VTTATPEAIVERAAQLSKPGESDGAVGTLIHAAGGNRRTIEAARDQVALHLHGAVDDYSATATLTLLNRTLSEMPRSDPLDWRVRWTKHRKP
jgi:hypothetical protein